MIKSLAAATLLTLALSGTAQAAREADGAWNCELDGKAVGSIGLDGNNYVFANPNGPSGKGALMYQQGPVEPTIVILDGALAAMGMLGGWLDASVPTDPNLRMVDAVGSQIFCTVRK